MNPLAVLMGNYMARKKQPMEYKPLVQPEPVPQLTNKAMLPQGYTRPLRPYQTLSRLSGLGNTDNPQWNNANPTGPTNSMPLRVQGGSPTNWQNLADQRRNMVNPQINQLGIDY